MEQDELIVTSTEDNNSSEYSNDPCQGININGNIVQDNTVSNNMATESESSQISEAESLHQQSLTGCTSKHEKINAISKHVKNAADSDFEGQCHKNVDGNNNSKRCNKQTPKSVVKDRKKDVRDLNDVLKNLHNCSVDEKFKVVCDLYTVIITENKQLKTSTKQNEKQIVNMKKECERLQSDLNKSMQTRNTLENLCRELQRKSKIMHEESLQKILEGEQKRKEITEKFQGTVNEINSMLKKDSDKTTKLFNDNAEMSAKLKSITEQYNIREQQVERMMKQMELESQLHEAKMSKFRVETDAEKEVLLREKQQLLMNLTEYQARCKEYQNIELALRSQISIYSNKYEEFQNALTHSNQVFAEFKTEMDHMSNKIVKLETETAAWKQRWENAQQNLLEMTECKKKAEEGTNLATKQMSALNKLCRTLQQERSQLLKRLAQFDPALNYNSADVSEKSQHQSEVELSTLPTTRRKNSETENENKSSKLPKVGNLECDKKSIDSNSKKNKKKSRSSKNKNESRSIELSKISTTNNREIENNKFLVVHDEKTNATTNSKQPVSQDDLSSSMTGIIKNEKQEAELKNEKNDEVEGKDDKQPVYQDDLSSSMTGIIKNEKQDAESKNEKTDEFEGKDDKQLVCQDDLSSSMTGIIKNEKQDAESKNEKTGEFEGKDDKQLVCQDDLSSSMTGIIKNEKQDAESKNEKTDEFEGKDDKQLVCQDDLSSSMTGIIKNEKQDAESKNEKTDKEESVEKRGDAREKLKIISAQKIGVLSSDNNNKSDDCSIFSSSTDLNDYNSNQTDDLLPPSGGASCVIQTVGDDSSSNGINFCSANEVSIKDDDSNDKTNTSQLTDVLNEPMQSIDNGEDKVNEADTIRTSSNDSIIIMNEISKPNDKNVILENDVKIVEALDVAKKSKKQRNKKKK